jgi:hypothetical protein
MISPVAIRPTVAEAVGHPFDKLRIGTMPIILTKDAAHDFLDTSQVEINKRKATHGIR